MIKKILLISILAASSISLFSQNILNSPYSRYGFGDLQDENYMSIRQMGGLGSSWAEGYFVNNANPASLPYLKATAYEVGIDASRLTLDDGNQSTEQWGGKFNYLGLAFPLYNPINELYDEKNRKYKFGMAFNLSRKSTVGYNITSVDSTDNLGVFTRNYTGEGGTYEFSWSNGVKYKEFSFGVKLGYLFGNSSYSRTVSFDGKDYPFNNNFEDAFFTKAFTYNVGFMYSKIFGKKDEKNPEKLTRLTVGVRASGGSSFRAVGDQTAFGEQFFTTAIFRDTIYNNLDTTGTGFLPGTIGFGANYLIGNRWGFGFEFNTTPWSKYYHELKGDVKNELRDGMSVSFGGFYRPNYKSYNNYFKRMSYRMGAYYHRDPREVDGVGVDQYGVTFGLGLPFVYQRSGSNASLGVDFGRKGQGTIIEETYLKLNFGFTFNDEGWFIKRKYN